MSDKRTDGQPKAVYYKPEDLTAEELSRYFRFETELNKEQLKDVTAWHKENCQCYAMIDEDYIFFTTKEEYEEFTKFWFEYIMSEEEQEIETIEAIA